MALPAQATNCLLDTNQDGTATAEADTTGGARSAPGDLACGNGAIAQTGSTAIGIDARATGNNSTAIGSSTVTMGTAAIALGDGASATQAGAIAIGGNSRVPFIGTPTAASATEYFAIAIGGTSKASGFSAIAVGDSARGIGQGSVAIGAAAQASGAGAISLGSFAAANHDNSTAIGASSQTTRNNQIRLGSAGTSVSIADIAASDAAQSGPEYVLTVDSSGTVGRGAQAATILDLQNQQALVDDSLATLQHRADGTDGGIAAAMAMGGMMIVPDSRVSINFNLATYRGEQGFAGGVVSRIGRKVYVNAAMAGSTRKGSTGGRVGVAFGL